MYLYGRGGRMKVYIVWGNTGEYEDYREWIAGIFRSEDDAKEFCEKCQKFADYMMEDIYDYTESAKSPRYYSSDEYESGPDGKFSMDYTGTHYMIGEDIVQ